MIAALIGLGLNARVAKLVAYIGVPLLIAIAVIGTYKIIVHNAYKHGHEDGVAEVDKQWADAQRRLEDEAHQSATRADDKAAERLGDYKEQAEEERKEVEDAKANGTSPLSPLFD